MLVIQNDGAQFDVKVRGFKGPFCIQGPNTSLEKFSEIIEKEQFIYCETFNSHILINVEYIEAIKGPNSPFPLNTCGERVHL